MLGNDDMSWRVTPTDKTVSQKLKEEIIAFISNNEMSSDMHTRKEENQIQVKYADTNPYSTRVSKIRLTIFLTGMVTTQMQIIAPIKLSR